MKEEKEMCPYYEDIEHCDGSDPKIIAAKECKIPLSNLMFEPFWLHRGNPINISLVIITSSSAKTRVYSTSEIAMPDHIEDYQFNNLP